MKKKKIGDIVAITKGRKAQKVFEEKLPKAVRYIQIEDLRTDNKIQYTTDTTGTFVSMNDLCIAWDGANAGTVGYGLSGVIGSTIARLRINDSEIYAPYIGHFLQSKFNILNGRTTGTTIPHVERNRLEELEFSCRPLSEQRRVAAILDKVDAIRRKRQHSLKLTASLVKSQFIEMFGDPVTNPMGWDVKRLDEVAETRLGKMLDAKQQTGKNRYPYLANFNVQWFRINLENLNEMDFNEADRAEFSLEYGDLLVCEGGEVGRTAMWKSEIQDCFFQKALHRVRCRKDICTPEYLTWVMYQKAITTNFDGLVTSATIAHLTGEKLKRLRVQVPPVSLQNQFAAFVEQADKSKFAMQNQLSEIEILSSALKQKFFA